MPKVVEEEEGGREGGEGEDAEGRKAREKVVNRFCR
jgi:hypothetical protein